MLHALCDLASAPIRESRIALFKYQLPFATRLELARAAWTALVPIPAMFAWRSEALMLLRFARDLAFASTLATAPSAWLSASVYVDLFVFAVHVAANWNFA